MEPVIRVGTIDDDRMLREATAAWLGGVADVVVTATASTVAEYLEQELGEDVVLLDLLLADGSRSVDNVARLVRRGFRVLVVSVFADRDLMVATLRAGAKGYLTKDNDLATLARTIREIASDTHVLSRELAFALSRDRTPHRPELSQRHLRRCQGLPPAGQGQVPGGRGRAAPNRAAAPAARGHVGAGDGTTVTTSSRWSTCT